MINSDRYLCKAKRTDNGEWVEGNLITNERNESKAYIGYLFDVRNGVIEDFDIVEVIPFTLCQYTGLTDKNGKKIWENDIVRTNRGRLCRVVWFSSPSHQGFDLKPIECKNPPPDKTLLWEYLEVIGNVFDNPELLGGDSIGTN